MALVDALAAAAQVGDIVQVALGIAVVRHNLEDMQLSICVDVARRRQQRSGACQTRI